MEYRNLKKLNINTPTLKTILAINTCSIVTTESRRFLSGKLSKAMIKGNRNPSQKNNKPTKKVIKKRKNISQLQKSSSTWMTFPL